MKKEEREEETTFGACLEEAEVVAVAVVELDLELAVREEEEEEEEEEEDTMGFLPPTFETFS